MFKGAGIQNPRTRELSRGFGCCFKGLNDHTFVLRCGRGNTRATLGWLPYSRGLQFHALQKIFLIAPLPRSRAAVLTGGGRDTEALNQYITISSAEPYSHSRKIL